MTELTLRDVERCAEAMAASHPMMSYDARVAYRQALKDLVAELRSRSLPPVNEGQGTGDTGVGRIIDAITMARTRLEHYADEAEAGRQQAGGRELKRKIWGAFAEFDATLASTSPRTAQEGES